MDVNKKQDFGDGLPPGSDMYENRKSSYTNMDFFIKWFTDLLLKHKASEKVVLPLDGHRIYCSYRLLLQTADENEVTIKRPPNLNTRTVQHLVKWFFGAF
jgi:hypothetical protein